MVTIAEVNDREILESHANKPFLPLDTLFVDFGSAHPRRDLADIDCIVVAAPQTQSKVIEKFGRALLMAKRISPPPRLLYDGDFDSDILSFLFKHRRFFERAQHLRFQDDLPNWGLSVPEFDRFGNRVDDYLEQMAKMLRYPLIFSTILVDNGFDRWKCVYCPPMSDYLQANELNREFDRWRSTTIDELFEYVPRDMGYSALVRRPSVVFPSINDLPIRSLITQRKNVGVPFPESGWYLIAVDLGNAESALRNQDQALLSEFTNRILKYHHDFSDFINVLRQTGRPLTSLVDVRNTLANAERLNLGISHRFFEILSQLPTRISKSAEYQSPGVFSVDDDDLYVAHCTIQDVEDPMTTCLVNLHGTVVPVDFPIDVLRAKGVLTDGSFRWRVRDDGSIDEEDILSVAIPKLDAEEESEIERLYRKHPSTHVAEESNRDAP